MSSHQPPKPKSRKTVGFFGASVRSKLPSFYAHMFIEDIHTGILMRNIGIEGEKPKKIEIVGEDDDEVKIAMGLCASIAQGRGYSARSIAQSAIESIALHLAWYGEVLFEVVDMDQHKPALEMVPDRHLYRTPFAFLQFIPKADRDQSLGERWVVLPRSHAWLVRMPSVLGGPRKHRKLLLRLEAISPTAPEFWAQDLQAGRWNTEVALDEYNYWQHLAVAKFTCRWGWDGRGLARDSETEFFHFYRGLRFRHARAVLRRHIVNEINQLFVRLNIRAELSVEGYPTPHDIERLIALTASGEVSYTEAYRQST